MTTNKKLGLLLLPLIPLSVLGIVEIASRITPAPTVAEPTGILPTRNPAVALPSTPIAPPSTPAFAPSAPATAPDA